MIRLFLLLFFVFTFVDAKIDIDTKIDKTSLKLNRTSKIYQSVNKKMAKNAQAILKQKREIQKQKRELKALIAELKTKESIYKQNSLKLVELKKTQTKLKDNQDKLEQELVFNIAQSVSLSVILEEKYTASEESIIEFEVIQAMLKKSKSRVKQLNTQFFYNSKNIESLDKNVQSLEIAITNIDVKRKKLVLIKKKNEKALKKLEIAKNLYKKELRSILKKQDALKKTLAKLNIIKVDVIKKAQEDARRKKALASKKIISDENLPKVKKHASSYQKIKTKRYRGVKTIAPLASYTITKKYGTYIDPIYGIKVFNESVTLKPKKAKSKVRTVFNGKVIYADKIPVLNNVVIVQHSNGLHTIYANLSQISNVKKGQKIKKGYTVGRVDDELIFEVTQKSYHINPIQLFRR